MDPKNRWTTPPLEHPGAVGAGGVVGERVFAEVAMDRRIVLAAIGALAATMAAPLLLASCARGSARDPAAEAEQAAKLIFSADSTDAQVKEGFLRVLDAIAEVASGADIPAGFASKIQRARLGVADGSPIDDQAVALLYECYRDLHAGAPFRMPASVRSLDDATREGGQRLESVRDLVQRGEAAEAASRMLEGLLLVVTPLPQQM